MGKIKKEKMWCVTVFDDFISAFHDEKTQICARAVFNDTRDANAFMRKFENPTGENDQGARLVRCTVSYELPEEVTQTQTTKREAPKH